MRDGMVVVGGGVISTVYIWGMVGGDYGSAGTRPDKSMMVEMSGSGGDYFRGLSGGDRSNGEGVGSDTVSQRISNIVGGDDLTVGGDVAVRTGFVSGGILDGVVSLEGLRVAVGGLAEGVLGVVLGFVDDGGGDVVGHGSGNSVVGYWSGDSVVSKGMVGYSVSDWGNAVVGD